MKSQDYIAVTHRGRYRRGKAEGGTIADDCDGGCLCSSSLSGVMTDPEELRNLHLRSHSDPRVAEWRVVNMELKCVRGDASTRVLEVSAELLKTVNQPQAKTPPAVQALHRWAPGRQLSRDVCFDSWAKPEGWVGGVGLSIKWSQCVLLQWKGWVDVCVSGHRTDAVMWILKRHFRRRHGLAVETGTYLLSGA